MVCDSHAGCFPSFFTFCKEFIYLFWNKQPGLYFMIWNINTETYLKISGLIHPINPHITNQNTTALAMESTTEIYTSIYPNVTNKHPGSMNTQTLLTVDTKSMTIPPTDSGKQTGDLWRGFRVAWWIPLCFHYLLTLLHQSPWRVMSWH